jgi:hypothetical protein
LARSPKLISRLPANTRLWAKVTAERSAQKAFAATSAIFRLMASAARLAAMPLRSEPDEAAVGVVLGTFEVVVAVILDPVDIDAEHLGHHLRHLDVDALSHLGAAVVHLHRTVGVDMHQRAGLVEVDEGEGDAEFHRRQRQALLEKAFSALKADTACRRLR